MCGRYRRTTAEEELARCYHVPIPPQRDLPISWNIAPSQEVLAIRYNPKTRQRSLDALRWGLIPYWAKDPKITTKRSIQGRMPSECLMPIFNPASSQRNVSGYAWTMIQSIDGSFAGGLRGFRSLRLGKLLLVLFLIGNAVESPARQAPPKTCNG